MAENIYDVDYKGDTACQIPGLEWIYNGVFGVRRDGTFVEVGAHDGKSWSNTWCLAEVGWSGLYIEPVEHLFRRCIENHANHPDVTVLKAMVGEFGDHRKLWRNPNYDFLFTGNEKYAQLNQATAVEGEYALISLDEALPLYDIQPGFELLVVDVEGMEVEVLKGFDCYHWRPSMVIIETHELNPNQEMSERTGFINTYFGANDYRKIYTSAINTIFLRM